MKIKSLVAAMAIVVGAPAFAAIAGGQSGNGELFLAVQNSTDRVSYAFDTGIRMDDLLAARSTGMAWTFDIASDPRWMTFAAAIGASDVVRYSVMALDNFGPAERDGWRLITTVTAGTTEAKMQETDNGKFTNGMSETQSGNFFAAVNSTGTHGGTPANYAINGSSVNAIGDSGRSYFGETGGLSATLNGNAKFNAGNMIGTGSKLYLVTPSSDDQLEFILTDEILPKHGFASAVSFDGATLTVAVPEPGTYALMLAGLLAIGSLVRRNRRG